MFEIYFQDKTTHDNVRLQVNFDEALYDIATETMRWKTIDSGIFQSISDIEAPYQNHLLKQCAQGNYLDQCGHPPPKEITPLLTLPDSFNLAEPNTDSEYLEHRILTETLLYLNYYYFRHNEPVKNIAFYFAEDACRLFYINNTAPDFDTDSDSIPVHLDGKMIENNLFSIDDCMSEEFDEWDEPENVIEGIKGVALRKLMERICCKLEQLARSNTHFNNHFIAYCLFHDTNQIIDKEFRDEANQHLNDSLDSYME